MATELKFERETCSRCGGSGHYSSCEMYGTTCFKCHGKGQALTARAKVAHSRLIASRQIAARDVKVGMRVRVSGYGTLSVQEVGYLPNRGGYYKDGVLLPHWTIQGTKLSYGCFEDTMVEVVPSQAEAVAQLAAAIEYQNSLTKAGKLRKAAA